MKEIKVKVPAMMCAHCEKRIRNAFENESVEVKELNLETKEITIETELTANAIVKILDDAGYDAEIIA